MKLSVDLGTGVGVFESESKGYNDGKWHNVVVHRMEKHVRLEIDSQKVVYMCMHTFCSHFNKVKLIKVTTYLQMQDGCLQVAEGDAPGSMTELSISEHFFIGGLPTDLSVRTAVEPLKVTTHEENLS